MGRALRPSGATSAGGAAAKSNGNAAGGGGGGAAEAAETEAGSAAAEEAVVVRLEAVAGWPSLPHSAAEHGQTERQLAERLCILPHVLAKITGSVTLLTDKGKRVEVGLGVKMRRQRLVAVGWARLRPAGAPREDGGGGGGGGDYVAGANEYGGGERRETWEYSAQTERTVRPSSPDPNVTWLPPPTRCATTAPRHLVVLLYCYLVTPPNHHHNNYHHHQVREYRAKFASLFSAIERRGPMDQGGPLTVAEALPEAAAGAAEEAGAGHSTT